jgi:hypothetical protein
MKVFLIVCGLAVALCGAIVSCGPQKDYCPNSTTGQCLPPMGQAGAQGGLDSGPGDATIITDDTGP